MVINNYYCYRQCCSHEPGDKGLVYLYSSSTISKKQIM